MRIGTLALLLLTAVPTFAADFPPVNQLPSRPELPDPLQMLNGERVSSREQWFQKRRPELKELFQHYMYGHLPPKPDRLSFTVDKVDKQYLDGKATLKEVTIAIGGDAGPKFKLVLVVPNQRSGPAPVFLGLNFAGNDKALQDTSIWGVDQIVARGYALATMHRDNVTPDSAKAEDALFLRFGGKGGLHDWATIAAWAWGLHRGVDYLVTDKDIDGKRIAVVGHSRLGKTALLAAAFDERIALAIPTRPAAAARRRAAARSANRSSRSTTASRTGSTATSRSSTISRTACRSISTAWWRSAPRGRCCSPTPWKTPGPIRTASSRCCRPPTRSIASSTPAAWTPRRCRPSASCWTASSATSSAPASTR